MSPSSVETARFHIATSDDIGYSEDYFDFVELQLLLRDITTNAPDQGAWDYDGGNGGSRKAAVQPATH
jgi:hypothetical protein